MRVRWLIPYGSWLVHSRDEDRMTRLDQPFHAPAPLATGRSASGKSFS
jgi:hypothetical protein